MTYIFFKQSNGNPMHCELINDNSVSSHLTRLLDADDETSLAWLREVDENGAFHSRPCQIKLDRYEVQELMSDWVCDQTTQPDDEDSAKNEFSYLSSNVITEPGDLTPEHREAFFEYIREIERESNEYNALRWKEKYKGQHDHKVFCRPVDVIDKNEWLVHYTFSDPTPIAMEGFLIGVTIDHIAISAAQHRIDNGTRPGIFSFAFDANDIDALNAAIESFYGENGIFFKADEAVKAYHQLDCEYQVIFDRRFTRERIPFCRTGERYVIRGHSGEVAFEGGYEKMIEWLEFDYPKTTVAIAYQ